MAAAMKQEFPEISETARLMPLFAEDKTLLQYKDGNGEPKSFYETKGYWPMPLSLQLFTYHFIEGNPAYRLDKNLIPSC